MMVRATYDYFFKFRNYVCIAKLVNCVDLLFIFPFRKLGPTQSRVLPSLYCLFVKQHLSARFRWTVRMHDPKKIEAAALGQRFAIYNFFWWSSSSSTYVKAYVFRGRQFFKYTRVRNKTKQTLCHVLSFRWGHRRIIQTVITHHSYFIISGLIK